MSNRKLENLLKQLKTTKTGKTILQAFAYRERDIRGTKDASGNPQYTMEIARLRTDIYNVGVKDGRDVVVPRKTELDNEQFYGFFNALEKAGGCEVTVRGKEGQPLVVNYLYSVKDMGKYALGQMAKDAELRTCTERDQINAANRAKHVEAARAAKSGNGHVPTSRHAGPKGETASQQGTVMGQSSGIAGRIEQAIASKIDAAVARAIEKAFGNE